MNSYIKVTALNGVVIISGAIDSTSLTFVGASCPASVKSGSSNLTSLSLLPEIGKNAIVGIRTLQPSVFRGPTTYEGGILLITWDGDKAICDLKKDFIPEPTCLATVSQEGMLTLTSGEHKFVYGSESSDKGTVDKHVTAGYRELKDSTAAFRFINGDITVDELLRKAGPSKAELDAKKILDLQEKVEYLEEKITDDAVDSERLSETLDEVINVVSKSRWGLKRKLMQILGLTYIITP